MKSQISNLKTQNFKIAGMDCSSCALVIDIDLEGLAGIISAKSSYAKQSLEVEYDPQRINLEQILERIKESGYLATPLVD